MSGARIRLQRSLLGRIAGGALLQPLLALLTVLLPVRLILAVMSSDGTSQAGAIAVIAGVLIALWTLGVVARAEADDEGVRWRYYYAHDLRWGEIEQVSLVTRGTGRLGLRHQILVSAGGRQYAITPASAGGPGRIEFARDLLRLAASHGVAAGFDEAWLAA